MVQQNSSYLVPEKEVRLTKLKLLYVEGFHERKSHDIEAWEDPASSWWQKEEKGGDLV